MSALRARLGAADPWVAVVGLVSLVVYALHGFDGVLKRDLGVYLYGAQRFLDGDPPYVGILNRAGPLAHVLPAVGIWVGRQVGVGDVHAARYLYLLISVACVCLVHVLARDLYGSRLVGVVSATAFLGFQGFLEMATYGPREKTPMVLFLLVAAARPAPPAVGDGRGVRGPGDPDLAAGVLRAGRDRAGRDRARPVGPLARRCSASSSVGRPPARSSWSTTPPTTPCTPSSRASC